MSLPDHLVQRAEAVNDLNRKALEIVESLDADANRDKEEQGSAYMHNTLNPKARAIASVIDETMAARTALDAQAAKLGFTLEHLGVTIGTIIHGVDLAFEQTKEQIAFYHDTLRERKVIFFREQQHITTDQHLAFGRRFGPLEVHPFIKVR